MEFLLCQTFSECDVEGKREDFLLCNTCKDHNDDDNSTS